MDNSKRAYSVDLDEMAHYEPIHQDLCCLQIQLFQSLVLKELKSKHFLLWKAPYEETGQYLQLDQSDHPWKSIHTLIKYWNTWICPNRVNRKKQSAQGLHCLLFHLLDIFFWMYSKMRLQHF